MTAHHNKDVQVFWSLQSPYCYLLLDRTLELDKRPDVSVIIRPVMPGVLRLPETYADRSKMERDYLDADVQRTADYLGLDYAEPNPSPVEFVPDAWIAASAQPRIGRLYDLFVMACRKGSALAFLDQVMRLLWDGRTPNWDEDDRVDDAVRRAGLDPLALLAEAEQDRAGIEAELAANNKSMHDYGHWGVPLMVFDGEPFYGQDRFDQLVWRLDRAAC